MNHSLLPLAAALAALAPLACAESPTGAPDARSEILQSRSSAGCRNVRGTIVETVTGANTAAGTIAGDVSGDVSIVISAVTPSGGGALHFQAVHTIVTAEGTLTTADVGVLSPVDPPLYRVNNRLEVTGGTGVYEGATGVLHTHGTANFVPGGQVELEYHGRVCVGE